MRNYLTAAFLLLAALTACDGKINPQITIETSSTGYMTEAKEVLCGSNSCRVLLESGRYTTIQGLVIAGEMMCQYRSTYNRREPATLFWKSCD